MSFEKRYKSQDSKIISSNLGIRMFHITYQLLPPTKALSYPVNQSKQPAAKNSIQYHRPCNRKDFTANSENLSLFLELNRRCCHTIGKACNRNQCTCTTPVGDGWINIESCQNNRQQYQNHAAPASRGLLI